jgi:hypothetical protein
MILPTPPELAKLANLSIRLYPEYLSTVEELSGRSVRLRTQAAISTDEEDGTSVAMSAQEARRRIPGLAAEGRSFHSVEEVSLDQRDLCAALPLAVTAAGVVLQEGSRAVATDRFCHGGGKLDRAPAGHQRRAAGDRERRRPALLGGDGTLS